MSAQPKPTSKRALRFTAAPGIPATTTAPPGGKLGALAALLRSADGATLPQMMAVTGWQAHSVRGALAGALKKRGLIATSIKGEDGVRRYRLPDAPPEGEGA